MNVKAIFIEGDNVIISSVHFDGLVAESAKAKRLDAVALAASKVIAYQWSDNDADAVADMRALRSAVDAL